MARENCGRGDVDNPPSGPYSCLMNTRKKFRILIALAFLSLFPVPQVEAEEEIPNLNLMTINGQPWKLSDYKGQVVLINFFATWCGPCRKEVPDLVTLQKEFGSKGLSIIGLAFNSDPEAVVRFAAKYKINYPVAVYGKDDVKKYGGVSAVPTTFLVDRKGKLAGGAEGLVPKAVLEKKIKELLKADDV